MKNIKFGFIQGRLTKPPKRNMLQYFPKKNWQNEFKIAHKNGFSFIEYFGERNKNINNPIWSTKEKKGGIITKENFIHISNLKLINEKKASKKEAKK